MTYQFKITLKHTSDPKVWRRITVPSNISFYDFHVVIQVVFGWENAHLFVFSPKGWASYPQIEEIIDEDQELLSPDSQSADEVKLSDIFKKEKQKFTYIYDFGDDWHHDIVLEKILTEKSMYPLLLGGKGACPPEDCGGPGGYMQLREVLADKSNPDYEEYKEWYIHEDQGHWNADKFDIQEKKQLLISVFQEEK
jgi:hypothetical protein